ncbi:hypothetical protein TSOC_012518, partial [Tetrabaena socialis]
MAGLVTGSVQSVGLPQDAEAAGQRDWQQGVQDASEGLSASVALRSLHGLTPPDTHSTATVDIVLSLPGTDARPCPANISVARLLRIKSGSCAASPHALDTDALTRAASGESSVKRPLLLRMLSLLAPPGMQAGGGQTTAPGVDCAAG